MIFDAGEFGTAWLSIAQAASKDKNSPALCKTVCVEEFDDGVVLVATDRYMLLRTWVPTKGADSFSEPPLLDDAPNRTVVVTDPDGRGKQLLAYARVLAGRCQEGDPRPELRLHIGVQYEAPDGAIAFEGMEPVWAKFKLDGAEEVRLQLYDGDYPTWRQMFAKLEPIETMQVALNPDLLGRMAKVSDLNGGRVWEWRFAGENKPAVISVRESEPWISGLAMPCRWDLSKNRPDGEPDNALPPAPPLELERGGDDIIDIDDDGNVIDFPGGDRS